tara:strand:+ start:43832 stop:44662 length:831 start_codon:yes stop_codon:yes gene_type:complete
MNIGEVVKALISAALVLGVIPAFADENKSASEQDSVGRWNYKEFLLDENGKWSLGVGTVVQNSPFVGEKISVIPIPVIDYSSKNLFIRGLRAGYHIKKVENPRVGGFFFDGYLTPRMRPGESRRKLSLDFGLAAGYQTPIGAVTLGVQPGLIGGGGTELAAEYSFTFVTKDRKHIFIPALKMTWQSRELTEYMWGIDEETYLKTLNNPDEVVLEPYTMGESVVNFSASATHVYRFDEHWNSMVLAKITALDNDILDNPAIERQFDYSFIFGFAYTF